MGESIGGVKREVIELNPASSISDPTNNSEDVIPGNSSSNNQNNTPNPPILDVAMKLDNVAPIIPDGVALHYLNRSGFHCGDERVVRLVSLAAQKFISDVANDALNYSRMRGANSGGSKQVSLSPEDLTSALAEYGITLQKPPYYH